MRLLEEILVLQLRVEPVIEHLDGPVQRDVLGDYKVSHTSTDNTPPENSSVSRHRGLPTVAARGASWSRRRRRNHLRRRGRSCTVPPCRRPRATGATATVANAGSEAVTMSLHTGVASQAWCSLRESTRPPGPARGSAVTQRAVQ